MEVIKTNEELRKRIDQLKEEGKSIGFVPTLGALHMGHASLIKKCKRISDITICSIFVNPTQFNDPKDLDKYPRTLEADSEMLIDLETDILYLPDNSEVYPKDLEVKVELDFGNLFSVMEGEHRPGHFDGVVQVVKRLLDIVTPDQLYMGQKDFQQFTLIQHMINGLELPVELVVCKIIREESGLAMSSRNERLDPEIRKRAAIIYKTLKAIRRKKNTKSIAELKAYGLERLDIPDFKPEYLAIVDGNTLNEVTVIKECEYVVVCVAVWAKNIRLIDNIVLKKKQ